MAKVICESVSRGLRDSESFAEIRDVLGKSHAIRIESQFLTQRGEAYWLPIGIVGIDRKKDLLLIELPQEADTGATRLWVRPEQTDVKSEALA